MRCPPQVAAYSAVSARRTSRCGIPQLDTLDTLFILYILCIGGEK